MGTSGLYNGKKLAFVEASIAKAGYLVDDMNFSTVASMLAYSFGWNQRIRASRLNHVF